LTGSGGCGKTRIALQAAADLLDGNDDGVWFVELASVSDAALVPQTIARALGLREEPGLTLTQSTLEYLRTKILLLVLDNCEHVLDACIEFVDAILRNCPRVSVLATSREVLGISGESAFRVPSLSLPDAGSTPSAEVVGDFEGVRLFVERALQVQADFALTDQNASSVAAICRRLDGIPLAIELAAARVRAMPVDQIEQRLDQRFLLLTGGSRSALPRQQTLRSALDWSFNLIGDKEKALLRRLSAFSGGCTLESAEVVGEGSPVEHREVLDLLTQLIDKSLVVYGVRGNGPRYWLLESVRQYAVERLFDSEEVDDVRWRHCRHYLGIAEASELDLIGGVQLQQGHATFEAEHDNLRSALSWSLAAPDDDDTAQRFIGAMNFYWVVVNRLREGNEWTHRALARTPSKSALVMSRAFEGAMYLAFFTGELDRSAIMAQESLVAARLANDPHQIGMSLFLVGLVEVHQGRLEQAEAISSEGLGIGHSLGAPRLIERHLVLKGLAAWMGDRFEESRAYFRETLDISRKRQDEWHVGVTLSNLAYVTRKCGDLAEASRLHLEGIVQCRRIRDRRGIGWHLVGMAGIQSEEGRIEEAARLIGVADALLAEVGSLLPPPQQMDHDQTAATLQLALGEEKFDDLARIGKEAHSESEIDRILALFSSP
jgi:predicted ATPase